ncbi:MAG: hypothetical protein Kow0069_39440 [Promethearchaeota archaeon]
MEFSTWVFRNEEFGVFLDKVPNFMDRNLEEGSQVQGRITFVSQAEVDEYYGPEAELEVTWESMGAMSFRHGRALRDSIREHNAIDVVVESTERDWLNHHEFSMWFGSRRKFLHKRLYGISYVHGLFFCDQTQRYFQLQARIYAPAFESYKPHLVATIKSIRCCT